MKTSVLLTLFGRSKKTKEYRNVSVSDFGKNPGNLKMFQYVPESLKNNAPLVIVLHGCFQNANAIAVQSGWNKLADENGFMVIYPQQKFSNNFKKCFNWYMESDMERGKGEVASIKQMIDFAVNENKIDKNRVFITGLSAGGAMTSVMLAIYPETFNAGAVMSGIPFGEVKDLKSGLNAMKGEHTKTGKEWSEYIKAINTEFKGDYPRLALFHGINDPFVAIINSEEMAKQYVDLHHIKTDPEIIKDFENNPKVFLKRYKNNSNEDIVLLYSIDMKHGISIAVGEKKNYGGKKSTFAYDTNFHAPFWASKFFGIIK